MQRFLTVSFVALALFISAAGVAPAAQAAISCPPDKPTQDFQDGLCYGESGPGVAPTETEDTLTQQTIDSAAAKTPLDPNLGKTAEEGFGKIMIWIMSLFAWLVGVAALTLDNAVYYTVVNMGDYIHSLTGIGVAWRVLRDLGNIFLVFGFLASGIMIILNVNHYGYGPKLLPKLLIAAVLLNFSLFISEAVIDGGNLLATQFYTQINGGQAAGAKDFDQGFSIRLQNEGISSRLMSQLGLQTIYGEAARNTAIFKAGNTWVIGFMAIILFIITAFVMFSLAFILIARFVFLVFLIIVSPIRIAGFAIPALEKQSQKWLSDLLHQTFIAPILLLLLYIALVVITDAQFLTGLCISTDSANPTCTANAVGWVTGNFQGFASFILSFLIAMGLLLYVVYKAKDLGAVGADWATKTAGKLTFGATAWAGRTSIGWGSYRLAKLARRTPLARIPLVGTGIVKGLDRIGTASFDIRGIKAGGGLKGQSIDAGEASKGGYKADLKGRIESRTKYANELTGRELKGDEKAQQIVLQNEIKRLQKERTRATSVAEVEAADEAIKTKEVALEKLESVTVAGAQRKYAKALNLWTDKDNFFNKYINLAGNTEAANKIRSEAKKGKPDKDFATNMKKLLKEAAEESGDGAETKPPTPSPSAPPSGPTPAPGGGTPPAA